VGTGGVDDGSGVTPAIESAHGSCRRRKPKRTFWLLLGCRRVRPPRF
jgi:hypothetical protein